MEATPKNGKLRMLSLHSLRENGGILQKWISEWPDDVHRQIDFVCVDAPFPAQGKSHFEGIFDPPYFEWVLFNQDHTDYVTFQESMDYIEKCCIEHGPIDGLLGYGQGGIWAAALPGLQEQGLALTKIPKLKSVIIISGGKLRSEKWVDKAYPNLISIPSLHFLGEEDYMKPSGIELLKCYKDPYIIHHPEGHNVPKIAPESLPIVQKFIDHVKNLECEKKVTSIDETNVYNYALSCRIGVTQAGHGLSQ
ncbi:hypothetical protein V2J09_012814 [Rumex salicifolius]